MAPTSHHQCNFLLCRLPICAMLLGTTECTWGCLLGQVAMTARASAKRVHMTGILTVLMPMSFMASSSRGGMTACEELVRQAETCSRHNTPSHQSLYAEPLSCINFRSSHCRGLQVTGINEVIPGKICKICWVEKANTISHPLKCGAHFDVIECQTREPPIQIAECLMRHACSTNIQSASSKSANCFGASNSGQRLSSSCNPPPRQHTQACTTLSRAHTHSAECSDGLCAMNTCAANFLPYVLASLPVHGDHEEPRLWKSGEFPGPGCGSAFGGKGSL